MKPRTHQQREQDAVRCRDAWMKVARECRAYGDPAEAVTDAVGYARAANQEAIKFRRLAWQEAHT
jgi:hypothetical protein